MCSRTIAGRLASAYIAMILLACLGAAPVSRTHYYTVEVRRPVRGNPIAIVNVTFYEKVSDDFVTRALNAELRTAVELYPPTDDVITAAWLHRDGTDDARDEEIGNGDEYPTYVLKLKRIMPFKQAAAAGAKK